MHLHMKSYRGKVGTLKKWSLFLDTLVEGIVFRVTLLYPFNSPKEGESYDRGVQ